MVDDLNDEERASRDAGEALMTRICRNHPAFSSRWSSYIESWNHDSPGSYMDISEYAHFIDEELFENQHIEDARNALAFLDRLFREGDEATRDLIAIGFIEDLQNYTASRPSGHQLVLSLLPPLLRKVWDFVASLWAGKSNLFEVIEAESSYSGPHPPWSKVIDFS